MDSYQRTRTGLTILGLLGAAWAATAAAKRRARRIELKGKVVVITGGGRGLGLAIAREFAARGCKLAICGRDGATIAGAVLALRAQGAEIIGASCDTSNAQAAHTFVQRVKDHYGCIDVLVNNAGQCFVGPAAQTLPEDFEAALQNIFWVHYHPTMAVLPHMRERRFGRIVNVTSIGGKLPIPHQAAYCVGKYATTGWSETLTTELAREGICVSTITPPPIKNGAALNVHFSGRQEDEFKWFTSTLTSPLSTVDAAKTARVVADAARYGDPERAVSALSWLAIRAHGLAPNLVLPALAAAEHYLPALDQEGGAAPSVIGKDLAGRSSDPRVQELAARAGADAERYEAKPHLHKRQSAPA